MARKKTTTPVGDVPSKPSNEGKLTRLAPDVVAMGKILAASEGKHLSDYLSNMLRGPLREQTARFMRENDPKGGGK